MHKASIPTSEGAFTAYFSERGLAGIDFPRARETSARVGDPSEARLDCVTLERWTQQTAVALEKVLDGKRPEALPPLDWSEGTEFQRRVWTALLGIGPGETRSYSEIAKSIGRAGGARAVGGACGANPIPVLVPCHRVLAAGGRLGGFSSGLEWKRRLLAREGVTNVAARRLGV